MDLQQIVASNIRQLRKSHNMTQAQLAEELDLSLDMVGRLERDLIAPSFKTLEKLRKVFRVDGVELFGTGVSTGLKTDRAKVLHVINSQLSHMSDKDLHRAKKLLDALT